MGKLFGGKKSAGPQVDASRTDFRDAVQRQTATSRENNLRLLSELQAQAQGSGPSFGTQALQDTTRRNLAQTLAAASTVRGPNVAAAKRNLVSQANTGARNVAEQGAAIKAQEQLQAQSLLSKLAEQQQQQDLEQVVQPGQLIAQAEAERFKQAQEQAANDNKFLGQLGGAILGTAGAIGGAAIGGPVGGAAGKEAGSAVGSMLSDKRAKTRISDASPSVKSFLDAISAKKYDYKHAPQAQKRVGVMAQDLEKSELGKSMVTDTPAGKTVDIAQALGASLAANAELHKRVKKLEKKS